MTVSGSLQIKNKKYYIVLNLYDGQGDRKQKWINTKLDIKGNKRRAEKMLSEMLAEYQKKDVVFYSTITVADYFNEWLEEIVISVRPNTYRTYFSNMKNHIIPYFENKKILLQELNTYDLEEYYFSKLQKGSKIKTEDALSTTTIKHHHQNISKALSDAQRRGLINSNPATVAKTPKLKKYKMQFLNNEQLEEMLILFKGNPVELPVILCAVYGFRRSEVLGLKWSNVDLINRIITISETLQQNGSNGNYTDTTKSESSNRVLPMTDSIYNLLIKCKEIQTKRSQIMGNYYIENDYVCVLENGNNISPNYLTRTFHSVISKSNLPPIRLHDLRHSVASNLLNNGFSVVQVQEWLGHGSASTTLNFYAHVDKTSKTTIANSLEKMIRI